MFKNAIQKRLRQRFFVTPVSGLNFSGVLISSDKGDGGYSVFGDVKVHLESTVEPVTGTLYIRNSNIAYSQEMPNADN